MVKNLEKLTKKGKIMPEGRHMLYNWETSPNDPEMVRLHIVIVDDKDRDEKLKRMVDLFSNATIIKYPFEIIRKIEGKVLGTKYRYLFVSYDTLYNPNLINFSKVSKNPIKDSSLKEKKKGKIEDYIERIYSQY